MALLFRPSNPGDAPAIRALCERVLAVPAGSPVLSEAHMRWKYWQPWPYWQGSRGFVLLQGTQLVAHAGVVPLRYTYNSQPRTLVQLLDWAADPKHVGAGVVLLKRIASMADGVLNVRGSSDTQRILKPLGFRSLGDTQQYALAAQPSAAASAERGVTIRVHEQSRFAALDHPLTDVVSSQQQVVPLRCREQIEAWLACPVAHTQYCEVLTGDHLVGCFLVSYCPGQARLADVWANAEVPEAWRAVIEVAVQQACQQASATEIVCQTNERDCAQALRACGFVVTGSDPLSILASQAVLPSSAQLRHHLLDSDLAYLHHGAPERWLPQSRL